MDKTEILTNIGFVVAGLFAGLIAYYSKKPAIEPPTDRIVAAGIGVEIGNRMQTDQLIAEVKRCADSLAVLADRKQAGIEAKLDRILEEMEEQEEKEREARRREEQADRESRRRG